MKNPSFSSKGKTKSAIVNILWLVLFFALAGFVQTAAQSEKTKKLSEEFPKEYPRIKFLAKKENRDNFNEFKKYLNTLKPTDGSLTEYSDAVDSVREIVSKEPLNLTAHNEWQKK